MDKIVELEPLLSDPARTIADKEIIRLGHNLITRSEFINFSGSVEISADHHFWYLDRVGTSPVPSELG